MADNVAYIKQLLDLNDSIHSRLRNEIEDALVGKTNASNYARIAESIRYKLNEKANSIKNYMEMEEKG